jgi:hypothetical protein
LSGQKGGSCLSQRFALDLQLPAAGAQLTELLDDRGSAPAELPLELLTARDRMAQPFELGSVIDQGLEAPAHR